MKIRAALLLSASFAYGLAATLAQKPAPPLPKPDYARESAIIEQMTRVYRFTADGTGSREISAVIDIKDEAAVKAWSVLSYSFASASEDFAIDYVRVRRPDGTLIPTPAIDAQQLPSAVTREAPFYSDLKDEQIPVRSLQPGDHLEYKFHLTRTKPEAPNQFWGEDTMFQPSNDVVALSEVVELHLPADKYANVWSPQLKPTITEASGERIYRWQSAQLQPVAGLTRNKLLLLDNDPDLATNDDPRPPKIAWTSFHSWAEVGAWYRSLEGTRTQPDDDIRSRVATLTTGKSTLEEKARAIYGYVGPQVRYIGVAFGIGRYQPHEAGDILRNQYGDCKDKTTLLISMLTLAGIPTDAVLIGEGVPFIEAVPSPGAFNHAINLAHIDGKPVWLDATSEVAPYRMLLATLRNVKALVIPAAGDAHIETTPAGPPFPLSDHFTAIGSLDDQGTSRSHIAFELRGDSELVFRYTTRTVSPAQWDELMQRISQAMSFAGKVTNAKFSRADETIDPFRADYDYEREKNGDWDNLRILPQLEPIGLGDVDEKDPPVTPIALGSPHVETSHAEMKLPKDWSADLPAAVHAHSDFATLDKTYKFENGAVITDSRFEVLKKNIPASQWHAYHSWFKEAKLDGELYIQLVNHSSASSPASGSSNAPLNPAAAALISEAVDAERSGDWTTASKKLDQAKKLNPSQPFLWSNYGFLDARQNKLKDAEANYRRELAAYPAETNVYSLLALVQLQDTRPEDAIHTLQAALDMDPANALIVLYLASILHGRSEYPAEEKVLRAGAAATPDNKFIKIRLGVCLLHQKKIAEGEPLLRDALTGNDDPNQLNDAAYELGDVSLDLPLAEQSARHCLDLLDAASTNGETGAAALGRTNLIFHTWDTLGWILFREGNTDEAEPWIRGAWRNDNSAEIGLHLALVLKKQDHKSQALTQLKLSEADARSPEKTQVAQSIKAEEEALKADGTDLFDREEGVQRLQKDRTYLVPRGSVKANGNGFINLEIAVTRKGTVSSTVLYGDDSLKPLAPAVDAIDLHLDIPSTSHATILRRAILSCHTAATCQLVLIPPQFALQQP